MAKIALLITKALRSRTLIVNYAVLIAGTLTLWTGSDVITDNPEVAAVMGSILAGVNIVLRLLTTKPLEDK